MKRKAVTTSFSTFSLSSGLSYVRFDGKSQCLKFLGFVMVKGTWPVVILSLLPVAWNTLIPWILSLSGAVLEVLSLGAFGCAVIRS